MASQSPGTHFWLGEREIRRRVSTRKSQKGSAPVAENSMEDDDDINFDDDDFKDDEEDMLDHYLAEKSNSSTHSSIRGY